MYGQYGMLFLRNYNPKTRLLVYQVRLEQELLLRRLGREGCVSGVLDTNFNIGGSLPISSTTPCNTPYRGEYETTTYAANHINYRDI